MATFQATPQSHQAAWPHYTGIEGGGADLTVNPEEAVRGVGNCTLRQTVTSRFIGQFANRNIASLPANRPKEGRVKTTTRLMWLKVHIGGAQARH